MKSALNWFSCLLAMLAACHPAAAHDTFIVSDPKDLQLVDLGPSYKYVSDQFEQRRDLLTGLRRAAAHKIAKDWGLADTPDKAKLAAGIVADTSAGPLQYAVVMSGDRLDASKVRAKLLEKYAEHYQNRQKTLTPSEATIGGQQTTVLPWTDGKGEYVIIPMGKTLVLGSTLPGRHDLLERVLQVVQDPTQRGEAPANLQLSDKGSLSPDERTTVKDFCAQSTKGKVEKFRGGFEKLYRGLESQEFKPEDFKSTSEKINELYLKHAGWSAGLEYSHGEAQGTDAYHASYQLQMNSPEEAQELKELILEKILFYKENAQAKAGVLAMDAIALDVQGPNVVVRADADSTVSAYNFIYAYLAFLLSHGRTDSYLGIN